MKKELYDIIFSVVPIKNFFEAVVNHYGYSKEASIADKKKAQKIIGFMVSSKQFMKNECFADDKFVKNPLLSGRNLVNVVKRGAIKPYGAMEFLSNPNFDSQCFLTVLKCYEENWSGIFDENILFGPGMEIVSSKFMPEEKLREYAKAQNSIIRCGVAINEASPADLLEVLSNDKCESVRVFVARNKKTPVPVLMKLSEDKSKYVRQNVAGNESSSADILRMLTQVHPDDYNLIRIILRNPNCPADVLEMYASYTHKNVDKVYVIRSSVAVHQNISTTAWETLYADPDPKFRNIALMSRLCPLEKLTTFVPNVRYAEFVANNIMEREDLDDDIVNSFLENMGAKVRAVVIRQRNLSQEQLIKHYRDRSKAVRAELARKLKDNNALMYMLDKSTDEEYEVRISIAKSLSAGSADDFIGYIVKNIGKWWKQIVKMYMSGSSSEADIWKVFYVFKYVDANTRYPLAEEMLRSMSRRVEFSEASINEFVHYVRNSREITNRKRVMEYVSGFSNFYSKELLDMCLEYIEKE